MAGLTRDLVIGAVPPAAIAGLLTFYVYPRVQSRKRDVLLFDALGLSVSAATGTQEAL